MSPLRFAANLAMMFREHANVLDRYEAATNAGFKGVECAFLYDIPLEDVVIAKKKSGAEQILLNSFPGDVSAGEMGYACLKSHIEQFRTTFDLSLKYCKALDCKKLHIVSGKLEKGNAEVAQSVYLSNLHYAAQKLSQEGIVGLIEPINNISVPGYFMNNFDEAIKYIKAVNSSNLKLQLDIFHLQHITGNLTHKIKEYFPYVEHIQIAQVPKRGEPNSSGEINYDYIFNLLQEMAYDGWIGCEYIPEGKTEKGLSWVKHYGFSL